jgi:chorismate lyase
MSGIAVWRRALPPWRVAARLRAWLCERGSLTRRCIAASERFEIRLLAYRRQCGGGYRLVRAREVLLVCDGVPVIYASTRLEAKRGGRLGRWLDGLGARSLGSLLFACPQFCREALEFCRLDARDRLYRQAVAATGTTAPVLWARRSRHRLGAQAVVVTEVFLPTILDLPCAGRLA